MDLGKKFFETIDKVFNKSQNDSVSFEDGEKVVVEKDIVYSDIDPEMCKLDYYYIPQEKKKFPVIFNIHGGGFMAGGKEYRRALATWYAINGFFVVNVNYGLCPECVFPEPIKHLVEAVNFVYENANKLKLDIKKIVVSGDSAGAHYAAALSNFCTEKKLQEKFGFYPKIKFAGAILNCGIYDFDVCKKNRKASRFDRKIFEAYTGLTENQPKNPEFVELCSPINHISKRFPPTMLIYAEKDIFCKGQGEILFNKLKEKDIYFECYHTTSIFHNHCFSLEWKSREAQKANEFISRFLDKIKNNEMPRRLSENGGVFISEQD